MSIGRQGRAARKRHIIEGLTVVKAVVLTQPSFEPTPHRAVRCLPPVEAARRTRALKPPLMEKLENVRRAQKDVVDEEEVRRELRVRRHVVDARRKEDGRLVGRVFEDRLERNVPVNSELLDSVDVRPVGGVVVNAECVGDAWRKEQLELSILCVRHTPSKAGRGESTDRAPSRPEQSAPWRPSSHPMSHSQRWRCAHSMAQGGSKWRGAC